MIVLVQLVEALAWPITTICIVLILRGKINDLIMRMRSFKYSGGEAQFDAAMVEAQVEVAGLQLDQKLAHPSAETQSQREHLRQLAQTSPRAAILEAWLLLEKTANEIGLTESGEPLYAVLPRYLHAAGISAPGILFAKLQVLRNQAVKLPNFAVSQEDAERYLVWVTTLTDLMKSKASLAKAKGAS